MFDYCPHTNKIGAPARHYLGRNAIYACYHVGGGGAPTSHAVYVIEERERKLTGEAPLNDNVSIQHGERRGLRSLERFETAKIVYLTPPKALYDLLLRRLR